MKEKTGAKFIKAFIFFVALVAIAVIVWAAASFFGGDKAINLGSIKDRFFKNNQKPAPSSGVEKADQNIPDSEDVVTKSAIEENIIKNTDYTDFVYTHALYTYEDENPVLKLNGTAKAEYNQEVYSSLTYDINQETYDSLVGLSINVEMDKDGTPCFSNDYSAFTEEETIAINNIIEAISEVKPDKVVEQTRDEQVHDVVMCLRKKNNRVTVTDVKFDHKKYDEVFYTGKLYIEEDYQDGKSYAVREYDLEINQLIDYASITTDNVGNNTYHFNPKKNYILSFDRDKYSENNIDDYNYLEIYNNSKQSDSKNSKLLEQELAKRIYPREYKQYDNGIER